MNKTFAFLAISTMLCVSAIAQNPESFGGLGMSIRVGERGVAVAGVIPNSPADYAGLQIGDIIVSADSVSLSFLEPEKQISLLRGKEGTTASLIVDRNGKQISISAKRIGISVQPLESETISGWYGKKENFTAEEINFLASQKTAEGHEALGVVQNGLPIPKSAENLSAYAVQRISAKKTDEKAESKPISAPSLLHFATRENFSFSLLNSGNVSIFLVNAKGEIVWRQKLESLPAGTNTIGWNVANLPNGSYQLRIEAENSVQGYKIGL